MPQVTSNTQIDTINILQESLITNDSDLLFIQRGATSYKLKKENLIIPKEQIAPISSLKVLGNISESSAAPSEIEIDTDLTTVSATHNTIPSALAVKNYVDDGGITQTTGSAPYYGCRAWASYNGVTNTINESGNISSIIRNSTGNYTISFSITMPDVNYAVTTGSSAEGLSGSSYISAPRVINKTTSSFRISVGGGGPSGGDPNNAEISFAVFR